MARERAEGPYRRRPYRGSQPGPPRPHLADAKDDDFPSAAAAAIAAKRKRDGTTRSPPAVQAALSNTPIPRWRFAGSTPSMANCWPRPAANLEYQAGHGWPGA